MTQTFEEYFKYCEIYETKCSTCKIFLYYSQISDDEIALCRDCMKKDYEENKK